MPQSEKSPEKEYPKEEIHEFVELTKMDLEYLFLNFLFFS